MEPLNFTFLELLSILCCLCCFISHSSAALNVSCAKSGIYDPIACQEYILLYLQQFTGNSNTPGTVEQGYSSSQFPYNVSGNSVNAFGTTQAYVSINLQVLSVSKLDIDEGTMTLRVILDMYWYDKRLIWNTSDTGTR